MSAWLSVFAMQIPVGEQMLRGTAIYFSLLILMRLLPRRTAGELASMDLVFIILIAEAAARGMGEHGSVADAMVLALILMGWNLLLNILSYRFPMVDKLVSAPPLPIIKDGRLLRNNLRREFITMSELQESLREQGMDDMANIRRAYVDGDGKISIVPA